MVSYERQRSYSVDELRHGKHSRSLCDQYDRKICTSQPRFDRHKRTEYASVPCLSPTSRTPSNSSLHREAKRRAKLKKKQQLQQQHEDAKLKKKILRRRKWSNNEARARVGSLMGNIVNAVQGLFDSQVFMIVLSRLHQIFCVEVAGVKRTSRR